MKTLLSFACAALIVFSSTASSSDLSDARALFERNLAAIQKRDKAAYLSCYFDSRSLVRTTPEGPLLGYEEFEKQAGEKWPDTLVADDLQLCLLYTSPSPRDGLLSRMPSSA